MEEGGGGLSSQPHPHLTSLLPSFCHTFSLSSILESIDISPDPPIPGQNLTVTVKGIVVSPITVR